MKLVKSLISVDGEEVIKAASRLMLLTALVMEAVSVKRASSPVKEVATWLMLPAVLVMEPAPCQESATVA